jgi:hypothetical protein
MYYDVDGAAGGNKALREYLNGLYTQLKDLQKSNQAKSTIPPFCSFNVVGQDGTFVVSITLPQDNSYLSSLQAQIAEAGGARNNLLTPIVHQIQSSTTRKYDASGDVRSYGPSGSTRVEVKDTPNQTRYFRMRSSFDNGKNFNNWREFIDPVLCGAQPVWSGLLRTSSTALVNSAAQPEDGLNAVTQHLTSTQIDIAGKVWNVGTQKIAYLGGSVDPGTYGTWFVYGRDQKKAGGSITYLATQNTGVLTSEDGIIIFATITTSAGGGGTGDGGGSCHIMGTEIDMYDGTAKDASAILKGDVLLGTDGGPEVAQQDAEGIGNVPCFTLRFENGVLVKGVSSSEPIMLPDRTFLNVFDALVGQQFLTKLGTSRLTEKTLLGIMTVWRQRLDRTKTFWADGLGSHNLKK